MIKKLVITIAVIAAIGIASLYGTKTWLKSLLPDKAHFTALKNTQVNDLPYITENPAPYRGKILAVVTSIDKMGQDEPTGYEHTELARAYWVFTANGFKVDIASPKGGKPPVVIDGEDMGAYDYAFLNDKTIQAQVANTLLLSQVDPNDYQAVYFVGGKGTMFDFPNNSDVKRITKALYQNNKVVSAVCHGPAALVNVTLDDGSHLLEGKTVSGFTNEEELFLIPDAKTLFPFLLEDKLIARGATFQPGPQYLEQVVQDGKLITGQNPWSVWTLAERVVAELGYTPKPRALTGEEHSIRLLKTYQQNGLAAAKADIANNPKAHQQILVVMHAILAFMQLDIGKGFDLLSLAKAIKAQHA
ncbi:type 1 glutamine amidotransferase domain-containing protein [Pseudoalteromonas spongiae]|uniref:type 1 glutamine amidotransferase domain-containing protein n=1 Tax=Pseudoalteromonas spongiae TaxID=298657 RepID=UPI00110A8D26|nr:type 1 glutamine amidotransferase domain-containing protein [Pseudoalteromonas spongiae]TMO88550.1 type 1 glutamine amidotransferase domain-containing protein [Pseudoalteromonas spongiae]